MSRNAYDATNDTLTPIAGLEAIDIGLSPTSENPVQNKVITGEFNKTYKDNDAAETDIADGDYFPFYDTSAAEKKKTLWSTITDKLKTILLPLTGGTMTNRISICSSGSPTEEPHQSSIEIRETDRNGTNMREVAQNAPRIGFHWQGRYWCQIALFDSAFRFYNSSMSGYYNLRAGRGTFDGGLVTGISGSTAGEFTAYGYGGTSYGSFSNPSGQKLTAARNYYLPNSSGTISLSSSSSRRVKKNIRAMTDEEALKLLNVNIVQFDYKDEWCGGLKNQSGVIAEEVVNVMPEVIENASDDYDPNIQVDEKYNIPPSVDYRKFIPHLIKMVQMQQEQINELKAELKTLKEN